MNTRQAWRDIARRMAHAGQGLPTLAGTYGWVLGALLVASPQVRAVDMDIYTKALSGGVSGTPVLVFQIDNSGSMMRKVTSTSDATDIIDQRLYRLVDVAMTQMTGGKGTYKYGITTYSSSNTGRLRLPAEELQTQFPATPGTDTYTVFDENDDGYQDYGSTPVVYGSPHSLGTTSNSSYTASAITAPYNSNWPFDYPAATDTILNTDFGMTAPTGSAGTFSGMMVGANGNVVIWYRHGTSSNTQVFKITSASQNTFITLTDANGAVLRSTSTKSEQTSGDCSSVVTTGNLSCLSHSMSASTYYRLVIGTDTAGVSGSFTFDLGFSTRKHATDGLRIETRPPLPRRIGLDIQRLDIPRGATITSAYLEFEGSTNKSNAARWRAGIDNDRTAPAHIRSSLFGRSASWTAPVTVPAWSGNEVGPDTRLSVTSLLQDHINHPDWCGGDVVFLVDAHPVDGTVPERFAYSYESLWTTDGASQPKLVVQWTAPASTPAGATCKERVVTSAVSNVSDDVQQNADGTMNFDTKSGTSYTRALAVSATKAAGMRFPLVPISSGTEIEEARLVLVPASGAVQTLKIRVVDIDNAFPWEGTVNALDALTYAEDGGSDFISWTPSSWVAGTPVQSVDISPLIEAVVSRDGWSYDNTLAIVIEGTAGSDSTFRSWEYKDTSSDTEDRARYGVSAPRLVLSVKDDDPIPVMQTHRWRAVGITNALEAVTNTPIMGAYADSSEYLMGKNEFVGMMPTLSVGDCASNGIVILTDGEETGSYGSTQRTAAQAISGKTCDTSSNTNIWKCTYDMVTAMYNMRNTHADGEKYSIRTDAIGFGPEAASSAGLGGIEGKGGGKYYLATDSGGLAAAFRDIISSMSISTASVAASGVAVNALNRFEHLDQLYYSLFAPSTTIDWTGNLKRYRLRDSKVVDVNNVDAIDYADTGFFSTEAKSFWSDLLDGSTVSIGGAASETPEPDRRIYTWLGANSAAANSPLIDTLISTNSTITTAVLGIENLPYWNQTGGPLDTTTEKTARRAAVISFLREAPVSNTTLRWGAAIHNSPRVVTYDADAGADNPNPKITVFYGDNRGFLHAISAGELSSEDTAVNAANTGGKELWSFIPKESLKNAAFFHDNTEKISTNGYRWGMDGDVTVYRYPRTGTPSKVYLFAGQRRGGSNYYALDVTKSHTGATASEQLPKLKWILEGGTGNFTEMGQSWSAMVLGSIRLGGSDLNIGAFTGGYDTQYHDDGSYSGLDGLGFTDTNQKGRALYFVNMETGQLVWKSTQLSTATFPAMASMKYSIAASPRFLDRNGDGNIDAIYVVDLAGQVFRFELAANPSSASNLITGVYLVAKLGATASGASPTVDNRRFYEPPSVARVGNNIVLALNSGYREEPRSKVTKEAFVLLTDIGAYKSGTTANPPITLAMLTNLTGTDSTETVEPNKPGWFIYYDQSKGEKGVGSPVIFNYAVLFSAWNSENADVACTPDIGSTALYVTDLKGAGLVTDENGDSVRFHDLQLPGMGDTPQIIFDPRVCPTPGTCIDEGGKTVMVGVRAVDAKDLCPPEGTPEFRKHPLCGGNTGGMANKWTRSRWQVIEQ